MNRSMKFVLALGSGFTLMGLMLLSLATTGCSGESTVKVEDVKIGGMSPGEYRDSLDPPLSKGKGSKGAARPKR